MEWDDDDDLRREDIDARRARSQRCQCGGDMPGRCPGPDNCPLCAVDGEPDATDEQQWIEEFAAVLEAAGVPDAATEAAAHVAGNPGIEQEYEAAEAAADWLATAADVGAWQDPAAVRP